MNIITSLIITFIVVIGGLAFYLKSNNEVDVNIVQDNSIQETAPSTQSGKTVDLSGKGLTKVPDSVFDAQGTEVLNVSGNRLSGALQAEVRQLSALRILDLSDNKFTGVPAEVGQLSKLEVLDLSNNPITGLPQEIGNLKNLKVLDLRGTSYSSKDLEVIKKGLSSSVDIRID